MEKRTINWKELANLSDNEIEEKSKKILSIMTLEEKVWQMSGDGTLVKEGPKMLLRYNSKPIPAGEDKELGIPGIYFSDGPRGVVMGNSTCFPVSMARGASWDLELEEKIGNIIGIEAKSQGANFFGGVCINLLRHPAWGRAQETYGEDSFHLGAFGEALIKGVQNHVMACAKHYACNSLENTRFKVDVKIDERTLREVYLWHFKKCVEAGVASIMSAYNKINGEYCGHNAHLLRDILKNEWKFKGFVITDFIFGIRDGAAAVNAGVDIEMPFQIHMKPKKLLKYLERGKIDEEQVDDAVNRIIKMKLKYAHDGDPEIYKKGRIVSKEHVQLALEAARKSIVLLKNDENILPLNRESINKIAVIGKLADVPNLGDHGSSNVYPPYVITPLKGIEQSAGKKIQVLYNSNNKIDELINIARISDIVIIVVGYTYKDEGEHVPPKGGDRSSLRLNDKDETLITKISSINKNCIVILEGGSSIIMEPWKKNVLAILIAWYPGMEGGTALGEILFGDVNPCAKLPIVFPKSENQLPYFDSSTKSIHYEYYHGYKLMDKKGLDPAFPFGFGLSYTSYSYKNIRLNKETINKNNKIEFSVDITNNGNKAGEEIIQLYISYKNSKVDRPVKELKGFTKIYINSRETKTATIILKIKDLAYYDPNLNQWIIEQIDYEAKVGPSSKEDDLLTISFNLT
ncbi:MAG: beta-glucosidase [Promethearchaeota archaeon]